MKNDEKALSKRELEVLKLVSEGLTNEEISRTMNIRVSTVKKTLENIYVKLEVHGKVLIVAWGFRNGLLK